MSLKIWKRPGIVEEHRLVSSTSAWVSPFIARYRDLPGDPVLAFEALCLALSGRIERRQLREMDAVIIGGGPLMETRKIENVWKIFR
jgi:hypothetical protein